MDLTAALQAVRLLAMDVDGVLTPGAILLGADADGRPLELKAFDVKDGLGISLAQAAGLEIAWITGRRSPLVERRAAELNVRLLLQGSRDKEAVLTGLRKELALPRQAVAYVGDDLNDLPAFAAAGVRIAVCDATAPVREAADWVTQCPGGRGAVREVVEAILTASGRIEAGTQTFLDRLRREQDDTDVDQGQ